MSRAALGLALLLAACASKPPPQTPDPEPKLGGPAGPAHDSRTPLEQRRDAACEALGPRITRCAVEDAQAAARDGTITQKQLADISAPEVQHKNTEVFVTKCKSPMSSRQVRVLEVCPREESQCAPMLACLEHLHEPGH